MADERPDWWDRNEAIRDELDLPGYEPPRFADGTFTHEVVPSLEAEFDVAIRFIGFNTSYPDAWELRVDGDRVCDLERRRDSRGNTVYRMTAAEVREAVAGAVGDG